MRLVRPTRAAGRERPCDCHGICGRDGTAAPIRSCSRWGLPCRPCRQERGALLPHRFALARGTVLAHAKRPCTGGLFSVALSLGSPPPAVSRHRIPVEPGLSSNACTSAVARPSGRTRGVNHRLEKDKEKSSILKKRSKKLPDYAPSSAHFQQSTSVRPERE